MKPRHLTRAAVAGIAVLALGLTTGATPAAAGWKAVVTSVPPALHAAELRSPTLACKTNVGLLGLVNSVTLSWDRVPDAAVYRVYLGETGKYRETRETTLDLSGVLILSLLDGLLFGSSMPVTVVAVKQRWESGPSNRQTIVLSNVVSGLLGGVECRN